MPQPWIDREMIEPWEEHIYGGRARSQEESFCPRMTVQPQPNAVVPLTKKGEKMLDQEIWEDWSSSQAPWMRERTGKK